MITIEELKGLKEWFHLVTGHLPSAMNATFCFMIDALIDAEIERQSVTDETQKHIDVLNDFMLNNGDQRWVDNSLSNEQLHNAAGAAIDALKAYRKI